MVTVVFMCCQRRPSSVSSSADSAPFAFRRASTRQAESMEDAANVYNAQGYRFCSVGFREAPFHKFPAMVRDAFNGVKAAMRSAGNLKASCSHVA